MRKDKGVQMIQWIGILFTFLGLVYTGVKDYQKGDIYLPKIPQKQVLTKPVYPIQYCLMAYDPNIDKVFYLHENGIWHDYAPQQRRYPTTPQNQNQSQEAVAIANRPQGTSGYYYGQSSQATSHTQRY
jgi:hypothetical protein